MTNDQNSRLLAEICNGAQAGLDTALRLSGQVENPQFQQSLRDQGGRFHIIAARAAQAMEGVPGAPAPDAAWSPLQSGDFSGLSDSRIAELMINGSSMGIIELTKKMGDYGEASPAAKSLCKDLIRAEEEQIEWMKGYL